MNRFLIYTVLGLLINLSLKGQTEIDKKLMDLLRKENIDSVNLQQKFCAKLEYGIAKKILVYQSIFENLNDSISNSNPNDIFGPFLQNDSVVFYKSLFIDSMKVARVGNIWIDKNRGLETAKSIAEDILKNINAGKDFNNYCILYSDDRNKMKDCDIGWFYYSSMVEPFSKVVFEHKKGDVFIVQTEYGYHVVKMLDNIKKERKSMRYIKITVPNKGCSQSRCAS